MKPPPIVIDFIKTGRDILVTKDFLMTNLMED